MKLISMIKLKRVRFGMNRLNHFIILYLETNNIITRNMGLDLEEAASPSFLTT